VSAQPRHWSGDRKAGGDGTPQQPWRSFVDFTRVEKETGGFFRLPASSGKNCRATRINAAHGATAAAEGTVALGSCLMASMGRSGERGACLGPATTVVTYIKTMCNAARLGRQRRRSATRNHHNKQEIIITYIHMVRRGPRAPVPHVSDFFPDGPGICTRWPPRVELRPS
jgi:hypothetical protein